MALTTSWGGTCKKKDLRVQSGRGSITQKKRRTYEIEKEPDDAARSSAVAAEKSPSNEQKNVSDYASLVPRDSLFPFGCFGFF